jgi:predicted peroxiredoxin
LEYAGNKGKITSNQIFKAMKNLVLLFIAGLMIMSCNQNPRKETSSLIAKQTASIEESVKDGIFIHIKESYNDPHRVLMPMKMANLMASDKDVLVYMDIHAVELLVKGARDMSYEDFESFQTYIKQLVEKNVGIYACPTCLKIAGLNPEDLMDGVNVAEKDKFFAFTKGRILTLDY